MDPVLKLYRGMRVMLTENKDVVNGIANGTQATIERVVLKKNESYSSTQITDEKHVFIPVKAVLAHQIDFIELRHANDNINPRTFRMKPQDFTFKASIPSPLDTTSRSKEYVSMKAMQLPIISNNATTGHKLQGCTVKQLFVHEWTNNAKNWIYVVLSRVKTMKGLFCCQKVPSDLKFYAVPEDLINMMEGMQSKRPNSEAVRHSLIDPEVLLIDH